MCVCECCCMCIHTVQYVYTRCKVHVCVSVGWWCMSRHTVQCVHCIYEVYLKMNRKQKGQPRQFFFSAVYFRLLTFQTEV
jgi:hypothetical protein